MYVCCKYTEKAILQMPSENKNREEEPLTRFDDRRISKVQSRFQH